LLLKNLIIKGKIEQLMILKNFSSYF